MEELQTSEALDREILEDARKKALKTLKNADDSIASSKISWEKKLKRAQEKIQKGYAEKEDSIRKEIMNRLPMDKRRVRSEAIDTYLKNAMEAFFSSLDRPSMLRIMERELEKKMPELSSGRIESGDAVLRYRGLSKDECSALAGAFFRGVSFRYSEDPLYMIAGSFPAVVIDYPHLRITVSVDRAAEALLLEKRAELAAALLGDLEDLTMVKSSGVKSSAGISAVYGTTAGAENG